MIAGLSQARRREYLSVLLDGIATVESREDTWVDDLCLDSRQVRPGSLFFAVPGRVHDGRAYIHRAVTAGANAIVFDSQNWRMPRREAIPQIGVAHLGRKVSGIADVYFQHPSQKLRVVGITGTNGKSSCALMTAQALDALGYRCGVIGTIGSGFTDQLTPRPLTTPDAISLQRELAQMVVSSAQYLCLEVSSHSLDQSRVDGVQFGTVVLTNLSQDHLDYHGDMASYRRAKSKLFTQTNASHAVLNIDDEWGRALLGKTRADSEVTYGREAADVQLIDCQVDDRGLTVAIRIVGEQLNVRSAMIGRINGINLTTVAAILHALNIPTSQIETALHSVSTIPGRLQKINDDCHQPAVYIDYAHTPDSLAQALTSVREITPGKLWCVFGCGGDRDRYKRPLMGAIAEQLADHIIITDDNPRSEAPAQIVDEITQNMQCQPAIEHNRRQAIHWAISEAQVDDAILIAGKGHETEQIYATRADSFSDRCVAQECLRGRRC